MARWEIGRGGWLDGRLGGGVGGCGGGGWEVGVWEVGGWGRWDKGWCWGAKFLSIV